MAQLLTQRRTDRFYDIQQPIPYTLVSWFIHEICLVLGKIALKDGNPKKNIDLQKRAKFPHFQTFPESHSTSELYVGVPSRVSQISIYYDNPSKEGIK